MTEDPPIELLEAQRRIRASQVGDLGIPKLKANSIETALDSLRSTLAKQDRVPDAQLDQRERAVNVAKLREFWNAPARHVHRDQFDPAVSEWFAARDKLTAKLGTGFTVALVGTRGPGKTQLAVELMKDATNRKRSAYYCTAMDYFCRIKDSFAQDAERTQAESQRYFIKPKLLVLDEMNVRSDSPWEDNMLTDLIGKRYNAMLDTVLISNQTAMDFAHAIGASIGDRLNETGGIMECSWKSFR